MTGYAQTQPVTLPAPTGDPSVPLGIGGTLAVLERHLTLYKRLWQASAFSSFVLPVLFLLSIGIGVGSHVDGVNGFDYLSWIVPGVLASTVFQLAVGESTYPIMGDFKWSRGHYAMQASPIRFVDMIAGFQLYIQFRALIAATIFLAVAAGFGAVHSAWTLITPLICALLAVAVSAPVSAFSARIENDSYFALLFRFVVIPSTLFAGVFFPVSQLPALLRPLAYASPLWHGVELCRAAILGLAPPWPVPAHVGYLLLWAAAGCWLAVASFRRRLQK